MPEIIHWVLIPKFRLLALWLANCRQAHPQRYASSCHKTKMTSYILLKQQIEQFCFILVATRTNTRTLDMQTLENPSRVSQWPTGRPAAKLKIRLQPAQVELLQCVCSPLCINLKLFIKNKKHLLGLLIAPHSSTKLLMDCSCGTTSVRHYNMRQHLERAGVLMLKNVRVLNSSTSANDITASFK